MKDFFIIISVVNMACIVMHEFDACRRGEWKMFKFLRRFSEEKQYGIFLWVHFPLLLFVFYYLWIVFCRNCPTLWMIWNILMVLHLMIHIIAIRWRTNVFKSFHSFVWIAGTGITSLVNLVLIFLIE